MVTTETINKVASEVKQPTEAELMAQMQAAMATGDFKQVAKVATELSKFQKAKEAAVLAEKQAALQAMTGGVKAIFDKVVALMTSGHPVTKEDGHDLSMLLKPLTGLELEHADGVWYAYDFGDKLTTCRLMKNAAKASTPKTGGGGGVGKKFDISTEAMLEKYGAEPYKETGKTIQSAYDSNTDKNWRYGIREYLLKKEGLL